MPQHIYLGHGHGWRCQATNGITKMIWDSTGKNPDDEDSCPHCCKIKYIKWIKTKGMIDMDDDFTPIHISKCY